MWENGEVWGRMERCERMEMYGKRWRGVGEDDCGREGYEVIAVGWVIYGMKRFLGGLHFHFL